MLTQSGHSYLEAGLMAPPLGELGKATEEEEDEEVEEQEQGSYSSHLDRLVRNLQEEAKDKGRGWVPLPAPAQAQLAYKKVCRTLNHLVEV